MDGTYEITVKTGKGSKTGTVELVCAGEAVHAKLDAPILGKVEVDGTAGPDDTFVLNGTLRVLFKRVNYTVEGQVVGDTLNATVKTSEGSVSVSGSRIH